MKMPNIYQGNYKLLIIVPILLVVASLFFIPQIKKGVDFKGGTLVIMQTDTLVDADEVKAGLEKIGFEVSSAKSLKNPKGYEVEIEIERDESLTRADELKNLFYSKAEEVSRLEADVSATNESPEAVNKYIEARKEIDEISNELFLIADEKQNASLYQNTNELKRAVAQASREILDKYSEKLSNALELLVPYESAVFNEVSSTLSEKFIDKALMVVLYSTILVSIAVFIIFKTFVPSIAVLIGAACDVIFALGAMGLFGIPLTLASFAALLMLVGFSLDTDILLTMRLVKRKDGTARERAYESMKTGATMSMTLLVSFLCLFILAIMTNINTYYEISTVAIAGLIGDLIATWMLNAVIVLAYIEKKGEKADEKPLFPSLFSG